MASEKPTRILLSKSDLTQEEISTLSDEDAWKLIYQISENSKDRRVQVLFTGFGASKKKELVNQHELPNNALSQIARRMTTS